MIAADDRNRLPPCPCAVRLLQVASTVGSRKPGTAASTQGLQQRAPRSLHLRWADRPLFIWLYRRCPRVLDAITIVRPETIVRWHRMGFAAHWRWKSRPLGGRPRIGKAVRDLIRRMSFENPLWGAPKIHGELLKLGMGADQFQRRSSNANGLCWGTSAQPADVITSSQVHSSYLARARISEFESYHPSLRFYAHVEKPRYSARRQRKTCNPDAMIFAVSTYSERCMSW